MATYIQDVKPPPNRILNFSLKDFSGGMNNRSDQIEDNEGAVLKNLMFADETVLETRWGSKYYNDKDYGGPIVFIDEYRPYRDEPIFVVATEEKIFFDDQEFAIKGKPEGVNHLGRYYFSDGESLKCFANFNHEYKNKDPITNKEFEDKIINRDKFDGMEMKDAAKLAVRDAEKEKKKTFVDFARSLVNKMSSEDESDKEAYITRLDAINIDYSEPDYSSMYLKEIGDKPEGFTMYSVVSPKDGHSRLDKEHVRGVTNINHTKKEMYYEPCDHEFEDHLLGANKVPEVIKYIVSHTGRLFASGHREDDDNIFITDLHNPLYYAVGLPLQVPPTSDKVRGLHVFDNSVVVGREHDIYVISGDTNRPNVGTDVFRLKRLNTHTGFASNLAVDIAHNYLIFLGSDGNVYALQNTRTYERDLATIILSKTIDLEKYPIEVEKENYVNASSHFHNDEWYLSIGDKVMVYSYRHMAWTMYTRLNMRCSYGIDGEWIWGNDDGRIAMFDKINFFDFGEPYESMWYSKRFDMEEANSFKQFREFYLVAHTFGDHFSDIYVTFEVDYEDIKDRMVVSNQIAIWGKARWGDRFITRNINESIPFILGRRGRNIRFKITNGYEIDGRVDDYSELENYPEKKEGMFIEVRGDAFYLYVDRKWIRVDGKALNQRMKFYQVNGDFEMRGKR